MWHFVTIWLVSNLLPAPEMGKLMGQLIIVVYIYIFVQIFFDLIF